MRELEKWVDGIDRVLCQTRELFANPDAFMSKVAVTHTGKAMDEKRKPGRPAGSGEQLSPVDRMRKSRARRQASGQRIDVQLDARHAGMLTELIEIWDVKTKKQAVERALEVVYSVLKTDHHR